MKGTEQIIAHIREEAEAKAAGILDDAEQKCAVIKAEYDAKAKETYAEKIRAGVKDCEERTESMGKIAGMEARKSMLSLKQEMVSACFERAHEKIISLPEEEYVALLSRLAASSSVSGDEEIVLNSGDREAVGEKVKAAANAILSGKGAPANLTVAAEPGDFTGGIILRRGNIETNCTAEILVEMCRSGMSSTIAGVLFE